MAGVPLLAACGLLSLLLGAALGAYLSFSADLPKIPDLTSYRPKTVSTFYAEDGTVIGIFYREKRFPIDLDDIPPHVVKAFLAAEDARFFSHPGVDWIGVIRALYKNIKSGSFAQGASTITQQVTRNFLLTREKKISRKIREWLLAYRLEKTLSKRQILEIYLNEVYLGNGSYGVESAARTYFGKSCRKLSVAEAALLAGLVPSPSTYSPSRNLKSCLGRRSIVLASMLRNGFISDAEYRRSMNETPMFRENLPNPYERAPYFTEAVRRYIVERYGEDRLYNDGLRVWTTCDLSQQKKASEALLEGAREWEKRERRPSGLVRRLNSREVRRFLNSPPPDSYKVGDAVQAVVVTNHAPRKRKRSRAKGTDQLCTLAMPGNVRFQMQLKSKVRYRPNDLLEFRVTAIEGNRLTLDHRSLPPIQGAVVCIENRTGYVRALVGGMDFERSRFNRAVQALRQPGSAFKPFVYAAALQWDDYSPNTVIVDEPIAVVIDPREEEWIPANSDRQFLGPIDVRQALVYSRNTATVKLIMDVGVDATIRMARRMGIESPLGRNLSICLGASEVTPLELTSAYSVFPNMGMRVHPALVKKVVDRFGNVLEDNTSDPIEITAESVSDDKTSAWLRRRMSPDRAWIDPRFYENQREPMYEGRQEEFGEQAQSAAPAEEDHGSSPSLEGVLSIPLVRSPGTVKRRPEPKRVLSPQAAYLMLSMLRETSVRGTAARVSRLGRRDLAGKTGTTDDCTDAWFIGFNPKYTTGVWIGYDTKMSLGQKEYGNRAALPVWMKFMAEILKDEPQEGYPPPPGIVFWGPPDGSPPGRQGLEALLEARPDLAREFLSKQISPVDTMSGQTVDYMDPIYGPRAAIDPMTGARLQRWPTYGQSMYGTGYPSSYSGMIRILSAQGETLGHAPYAMDENGKLVVYRDRTEPVYQAERETYDEERNQPRRQTPPLQSFLPRAARFLRNLQQFLPPGIQFEWTQ
ncbi:MAG: transglycosylase domain-containing protein [Deltaproteobacteria bacterium]